MPYFSDTLNILSHIAWVNEFPFPWAHTSECFPNEIYKELVATRPHWLRIAGEDRKDWNNRRIDCPAYHALNQKLPVIWHDFMEYHTSHAFYLQVITRFGKYFTEYYPNLDLKNFKTAVRGGTEKADIYLDCQFSINTPVTQKGTVSKPHVDNPLELWASLLYMKEPEDRAGGDLVLYKCRDLPIIVDKRDVEPKNLIPWRTLPYAPNTLACFVNTPFSVHSVTEREITDKPRLFMNISLEFVKPEDQIFIPRREVA